MSEISKVIASEIADFFAGFGGPGEPDIQSDEAQRLLTDRVLSVLALRERAEPVDDDSEIKWRELALQFDGHRMQAICFLKQILKELPEAEFSSAREFLKAGPLPGEEVLRNRIAALAQPAPGVPDALEHLRSIVADPRALPRRKEWISGQQYSYVLLENVEAMVDEACRAAMIAAPGKN